MAPGTPRILLSASLAANTLLMPRSQAPGVKTQSSLEDIYFVLKVSGHDRLVADITGASVATTDPDLTGGLF
jgi:hypothetical protein